MKLSVLRSQSGVLPSAAASARLDIEYPDTVLPSSDRIVDGRGGRCLPLRSEVAAKAGPELQVNKCFETRPKILPTLVTLGCYTKSLANCPRRDW